MSFHAVKKTAIPGKHVRSISTENHDNPLSRHHNDFCLAARSCCCAVFQPKWSRDQFFTPRVCGTEEFKTVGSGRTNTASGTWACHQQRWATFCVKRDWVYENQKRNMCNVMDHVLNDFFLKRGHNWFWQLSEVFVSLINSSIPGGS